MSKKYRIVQMNFPYGTEYEVQAQYWRQVSGKHRFTDSEEASKRLQYLKNQGGVEKRVIYEN